MIHNNFARILAERLHAGQTDKHGAPYIYHLYRVVALLGAELADDLTLSVGFLHDILEDTSMSREALHALGFPEDVIEAVDLLTKPANVQYATYIDELIDANNRIALLVKRADLRDHLFGPKPCPAHLRERYEGALAAIEAALHLFHGRQS